MIDLYANKKTQWFAQTTAEKSYICDQDAKPMSKFISDLCRRLRHIHINPFAPPAPNSKTHTRISSYGMRVMRWHTMRQPLRTESLRSSSCHTKTMCRFCIGFPLLARRRRNQPQSMFATLCLLCVLRMFTSTRTWSDYLHTQLAYDNDAAGACNITLPTPSTRTANMRAVGATSARLVYINTISRKYREIEREKKLSPHKMRGIVYSVQLDEVAILYVGI